MKNPLSNWEEEKRNRFLAVVSSTLGYGFVLFVYWTKGILSDDWRKDVLQLPLVAVLTYVFHFALFRFLKWRDKRRIAE